MNNIKFEKYHGCGNDFIIVEDEGLNYQAITRQICNRCTGFGADGLIVARTNPLRMMLYNQDGSIANMCGNGIRCLAYYFVRHQHAKEKRFIIETLDGPKEVEVISKEPFRVKINMGSYSFDKEKMGFTSQEDMLNYEISFQDNTYLTHSVFIGTYHTIVYMPKVEYGLYPRLGETIQNNPAFKYGTNVDFVEVIDRNTLKINTYERGIGFTYACGTGASASYVISKMFNKCSNPVKVILPYGELKISEENKEIYMEGPSKYIGDGSFDLRNIK